MKPMMPQKPEILEMTVEQLRRAVVDGGWPAYRADQLADWVWRKGVTDPAEMSNLPKGMLDKFDLLTAHIANQATSEDGTVKLLIELADGEHHDAEVIPDRQRVPRNGSVILRRE